MTDVSKRYPGAARDAVANLDLEIESGEIFGLLGPNGAGKTTTVGMATTLLRPTSGTIRVAGHDVVHAPERARAHIGVVTQQNSLDNQLTVRRGIYCHCRYFAFSRAEAKRRTHVALERLDLGANADRMPVELSGGLAQRAMIARALSHDPAVLFVDEPTSGLDPEIRQEVWSMIRRLRSAGSTILLTTHNLDEADALCDRIAIMREGRIVVCDTPDRVKALAVAQTVLDVVVVASERSELARRALEVLPGVDVAEDVGNGRIRVRGNPSETLVSAVFAEAQQFGLLEINVVRPSLETVFLQLMRSERAPLPSKVPAS
jgi:ABC-2 type transport system ATP-binding protein